MEKPVTLQKISKKTEEILREYSTYIRSINEEHPTGYIQVNLKNGNMFLIDSSGIVPRTVFKALEIHEAIK